MTTVGPVLDLLLVRAISDTRVAHQLLIAVQSAAAYNDRAQGLLPVAGSSIGVNRTSLAS